MRKKKTESEEEIESDKMEAKWIEFAELMYEHSEQLYSDKTLASLKEAMSLLNPMDREIFWLLILKSTHLEKSRKKPELLKEL